MTNWLPNFDYLTDAQRKEVNNIYVQQSFPANFRECANEFIIKQDRWNTMGQNNRIVAFTSLMKLVQKKCPSEENFFRNAREKQSTYCDRLNDCFNEELALKLRPRKPAQSSAAASSSSAVLSMSATLQGAPSARHSSRRTANNQQSTASESNGLSPFEKSQKRISRLRSIGGELVAAQKEADYEKLLRIKEQLRREVCRIRAAICCWQRQQQMYANEFEDGEVKVLDENGTESFYSVLNDINREATAVYSLLCDLIKCSKNFRSLDPNFANLCDEAFRLIIQLTRVCFIVTRQPDQILKADNKFGMTVSLLVGGQGTPQSVPVHCCMRLEDDLLKCAQSFEPNAPEESELMARDEDNQQQKISVIAPEVKLESYDNEEQVVRTNAGTAKRSATTVNKKKEAEKVFVAKLLPQALHADFAGIRWKKVDAERRNAPNSQVTDLKYALVFEVQWTLTIEKIVRKVTLRCMSLPIACVVHVNQDARASGTIFWDNAFAAYKTRDTACNCVRSADSFDQSSSMDGYSTASSGSASSIGTFTDVSGMSQVTVGRDVVPKSQNGSIDSGSLFGDGNDNGGIHYCRLPFQVPEKVGWPVFKRELNRWFKASTGTELSESHLDFVKHCIIPDAAKNTKSFPVLEVMRARVLNDSMEPQIQGCTFWVWLFCVKKLIIDDIDPLVGHLWRAGRIHFATHPMAERMLELRYPDPAQRARSMLIRFCNSDPNASTNSANVAAAKRGAIVITHYFFSTNVGGLKCRSLKPWNSERLKEMSLIKRLESPQVQRDIIYPDSEGSWKALIGAFEQPAPKNPSVADKVPIWYCETDNQLVIKDEREASSSPSSAAPSPYNPPATPGTPFSDAQSQMMAESIADSSVHPVVEQPYIPPMPTAAFHNPSFQVFGFDANGFPFPQSNIGFQVVEQAFQGNPVEDRSSFGADILPSDIIDTVMNAGNDSHDVEIDRIVEILRLSNSAEPSEGYTYLLNGTVLNSTQ